MAEMPPALPPGSPAALLARLLIWLASIGLVAMTAIIGWQVIGRFILNASPSWSEQASLVLMIWYVMLASAAGVYEGFHIRIAVLEDRLGGHAVMLRRIVALVTMGLGLIMLIHGAQLVWAVRGTMLPSLGVSRAVAYAPLPLAGAMFVLFALPLAISGARTGDAAEMD
jgi:TRAP-type C4-dicarboxylate transport system permease small subunit